ncbi:MAG: PUR family DNA/RNA-binding protein [Bacteroidales bacterium]|nr:PUR family DNA/RNA-binding protein [Bacteroidales bacterium]
MEGEKTKNEFDKTRDNEIIYSRAIRAGRRIYYLDVKKSRNGDLYLAITESKRKVTGYDDNVQVTYEKYKIFLYKEDFESFMDGMNDVIGFITREQGVPTPRAQYVPPADSNKDEEVDETQDETQEETVEENEETTEPKRSFFDKFKF